MTEEKEVSTNIEVECPSCAELNVLNQARDVSCEKCKKSITGHRYGVKTFSLGIIPFLVGAFGYGYVDRNYLSEDRYPLAVEYSMVNACTNSDIRALPRRLYDKKQEVCICAVEKTVEVLPFSELEERKSELREVVSSKVNECV